MYKFCVTGDKHGSKHNIEFAIDDAKRQNCNALIILGDAGFNFYLNSTDKKLKSAFDFPIYCVRGNHEERPQNIATMKIIWDDAVGNYVYYEPEFQNIKYFMDGFIYTIEGYTTLVIGGAYSIDKYYRQTNYMQKNGWCGWFEGEQLTKKERKEILNVIKNDGYDFVFSHTCPIIWEPKDLFLPMIDQSTVDKTMEEYLELIRTKYVSVNYAWLFGHYHADRVQGVYGEMFYHTTVPLAEIAEYWKIFSDSLDKFEKVPFSKIKNFNKEYAPRDWNNIIDFNS